ncbi:MAG: hypothetical protein ACREOS_03135 [Candidatus Dormibacteraceae bacterium]
MPRRPLRHVVRIRSSDDLHFVRPGLMDEVLVNANHLENSSVSTTTTLRESTVPFMVDPVLTRFQVPEWWRNQKGETKRNYTRLGGIYVAGTSIQIAEGPLLQTVPNDDEWRLLARNVLSYEMGRLEPATQLDLLDGPPLELRPTRLMAPALVAFSDAEDRINRLLAEASADLAELALALPVIVPLERLLNAGELRRLIASIPTAGITSYLIWTPNVTEERMLSDDRVFGPVLHLVTELASRGVSVGHLHGTYTIAALHDLGIDTFVHDLGWVDKGDPADERGGGPRSCSSYVPGIRHTIRFDRARDLGYPLDATEYIERYCSCDICVGTFEGKQHPLDVLLEEHPVNNMPNRQTPTGRATELNRWHYLIARRQEVEAFSTEPAVDVVARDMERAAALAGTSESNRLRRLAEGLR